MMGVEVHNDAVRAGEERADSVDPTRNLHVGAESPRRVGQRLGRRCPDAEEHEPHSASTIARSPAYVEGAPTGSNVDGRNPISARRSPASTPRMP